MPLCVDMLCDRPHLRFKTLGYAILINRGLDCNIIIILSSQHKLQLHVKSLNLKVVRTSLFLFLGKASITKTQSYQSASDQTFGHQ